MVSSARTPAEPSAADHRGPGRGNSRSDCHTANARVPADALEFLQSPRCGLWIYRVELNELSFTFEEDARRLNRLGSTDDAVLGFSAFLSEIVIIYSLEFKCSFVF